MTTKALPLDEEKQYQDLFAMYATPGWKALMASAEETIEFIENVRNVRSADELKVAQGKLFILDWLVRHKEATELAYALATREEDPDVQGV